MALAPYFERAAIAAAQVVHGHDLAALTERLDVTVGLTFDAAAATAEGVVLLEATTRLLARLYPTLAFNGPAAEVEALAAMATAINPDLSIVDDEPDVEIVVGSRPGSARTATLHASSDGWDAQIGLAPLPEPGSSNNPFGAAAAACLAVANVFRAVMLDGSKDTLDQAFTFSTFDLSTASSGIGPDVPTVRLSDSDVLVGAGAIGSAAAWTLGRAPISGALTVVDPELLEMGNLQRYIGAAMVDVGHAKTALAARDLQLLTVTEHASDWAGAIASRGHDWERVLLAVDSAEARRMVQSTLPRSIVNAWTQPGDLGVSTHPRFGNGACVRCLYLPDSELPSEDLLLVDALKLDHAVHGPFVRRLLYTGEPPPPQLLDDVSTNLGVQRELLEPFASRPLRDLYVEGICGGMVLPLDRVGQPPQQLHVPLAHQSALAGVLLAAAIASASAFPDAHASSMITRLNILRPLGEFLTVPAQKEPRGLCICHDTVWLGRYDEKYSPRGG